MDKPARDPRQVDELSVTATARPALVTPLAVIAFLTLPRDANSSRKTQAGGPPENPRATTAGFDIANRWN
jgi:hypothetical protein